MAETRERRLAKLMRRRFGNDFISVVADIKLADFKRLKLAIERVPQDERDESLHRERLARAAALAAEALELPEPNGPEERAILARYGFAT